MQLTDLSLPALTEALSRDDQALIDYVNQACQLMDAREPEIQALIPEPGRRARLLADAQALSRRYPTPSERPPLYGILVGVKDIFHVDGFLTRAGTEVPADSFQGPEAEVVRRLRRAGALILGKTVTTEFAYFEPGPTRNPHNPEHTPGGSSSGSAAAVAAGFCGLSLGTQTVGSVIRPAAFCGIVGYKPSYDRIPTAGLIYFSPSVDHVGLFTRDVTSMALVAGALCQAWQPKKAARATMPVLGVPRGPYLDQTEPQALAHFERTLERLSRAGVAVRQVPALEEIRQIELRHTRLISAELAEEHRTRFPQHESLYRPRTAQLIRDGRQVPAAQVEIGRSSRRGLRRQLEETMARHGFDLWVTPAAPGPAPHGIQATGSPAMNLPWTHAGLPALTLPAGHDSRTGLPLGLQLVAGFGEDEGIMAWAELLAPLLG